MAMLDTYLRLPPFHYSQGEEWFNFAHENIRNTLNITYVKIKKKKDRADFQTATSSSLLKFWNSI